MDTDKAYLLGLIIGGGVFGNAEDVFSIRPCHIKNGVHILKIHSVLEKLQEIFYAK